MEDQITVDDTKQMIDGMVFEAMEVEISATEKKQVTWNKLGDFAVADFPCGKQIHFDLTKLSTTVLKYYGAKQWLADQVASEKIEADKIAGMKESYKEAVAKGLELSPTGKIGIVGKTRSNASGAKAFETNMKTAAKVVSLDGLMLKKAMSKFPGQEAFTEADEAKLQEFLAMVVESKE